MQDDLYKKDAGIAPSGKRHESTDIQDFDLGDAFAADCLDSGVDNGSF